MTGKYQRVKRVSLHFKVTYVAPVNTSSDESDIESSDKEEKVQKYQKQRETS